MRCYANILDTPGTTYARQQPRCIETEKKRNETLEKEKKKKKEEKIKKTTSSQIARKKTIRTAREYQRGNLEKIDSDLDSRGVFKGYTLRVILGNSFQRVCCLRVYDVYRR